jgi:squalene synthase HpnC
MTAVSIAPSAAEFASGKGHKDENFPVASVLIAPRFRAPVMAFYRFARASDDIADNETASADAKLAGLAHMRAGLDGDGAPEATALRTVMAERRIDPVNAHELLDAFVLDVTKRRHADWDSLIAYCRLSAMPVGRFVLDAHGESRETWPANDALCAALQIVNHLQDCAEDYRTIDRVYIPLDTLAKHGAQVEELGADRAPPGLRAAIVDTAERTLDLLRQSSGFAVVVRDRRLSAEIAVIQKLATSLCHRLLTRDPLSERVHHTKPEAAMLALGALVPALLRRPRR